MSEAVSNEAWHHQGTQPKPDLSVVHDASESNFEITYATFNKDSYLTYLAHTERAQGADALIKLLEQLGTIPNELEPTADAQLERNHKIERIAKAKQFFDDLYIDPASPIGKNRVLLGELFEKTEAFDANVVLQALANIASDKSLPKNLKPVINEAEYLYRIILADEHDITLIAN